MRDPGVVVRRRAALEAVHDVALVEQKLGEVGAVLLGGARGDSEYFFSLLSKPSGEGSSLANERKTRAARLGATGKRPSALHAVLRAEARGRPVTLSPREFRGELRAGRGRERGSEHEGRLSPRSLALFSNASLDFFNAPIQGAGKAASGAFHEFSSRDGAQS